MLDRAVLYVLLCRRRKHNEDMLERKSDSQEIRSLACAHQWEHVTEVIQGFVSCFGFQQWLVLKVLQESMSTVERAAGLIFRWLSDLVKNVDPGY